LSSSSAKGKSRKEALKLSVSLGGCITDSAIGELGGSNIADWTILRKFTARAFLVGYEV